jgi:hypothetical protein
MKKVIRLTESDLVRLVKRVIKEQEEDENDKNWTSIVSSLLSTNPKQIKMKDGNHSLNWGSHSAGGYDWGLSIGKTGTFTFQSENNVKSKQVSELIQKYGFPIQKTNYNNGLHTDSYIGFPTDKLITLIKEIINICKQKMV